MGCGVNRTLLHDTGPTPRSRGPLLPREAAIEMCIPSEGSEWHRRARLSSDKTPNLRKRNGKCGNPRRAGGKETRLPARSSSRTTSGPCYRLGARRPLQTRETFL